MLLCPASIQRCDLRMAEKEEKSPDLSWLPAGKKPLADGDYDAIVMGTGLKVSEGPPVCTTRGPGSVAEPTP